MLACCPVQIFNSLKPKIELASFALVCFMNFRLLLNTLISVAALFAVPASGADSCGSLPLSALSFQNIKTLIQNPSCGVRTVSDVLAKLPKEFTANYMLFYRSRSLQGPHETDYLNPRALVFTGGNKSAFILTFNGKPSQPGYKALEMVEIHPESPDNVFRYFEIGFPFGEEEIGKRSWTEVQSGIAYSKANPARCTACHGTPARPIMAGYPDWEGAFGSLHVAPSPPEEQNGFAQYIAKVKGPEHSRYKYLGDIQGYMASSDLDQLLAGRDMTNSSLHHLLGSTNSTRVASLVLKTPDYQKMKYALTAAFADCGNPFEYVPKPLLSQLFANIEMRFGLRTKWRDENVKAMYQRIYNFDRLFLLSDLVFQNRAYGDRLSYSEYLNKVKNKLGSSEDYERLQLDTIQIQGIQRGDYLGGDLRLLLEGRGLKIDNWFTDLTQPTYRYHDGGAAAFLTAKAIAALDPNFDATLKGQFAQPMFEGGVVGPELDRAQAKERELVAARCERLKTLSLQSLNGFSVSRLLPPKSGPTDDGTGYPVVFKRTCATCHTGNPPLCTSIPFNSPFQMANWISDRANARALQERILSPDETARMPPTEFLSDEDLNEILKYLTNH